MLNELLSAIGYRQKWHICWIANIPGKMTNYGDGTYIFTPRLTSDCIKELREKLAEDTSKSAGCEVMPEQINITGMYRIGA